MFKGYQDRCHSRGESANVRVLLAMMAVRFRIDRSRGQSRKLTDLLRLKLEGFKMVDVQKFLHKVQVICATIDSEEMSGLWTTDVWFDWLFGEFKDWHPIRDEVKIIRRAERGSKERTLSLIHI